MNNLKLFYSPDGEEDKHAYQTSLEKKVRGVLTPFQGYIKSQTTASAFLFVCTLVALIWASFPSISNWYLKFINISIGFHIANFLVEESLKFWVNDFLLTLFFFFVGLEIKREFLVGELTDHKRGLFVLFAAFGGMILPALIYFLININTPTQLGWGIPMATDTAFALGVLNCFKKSLPKGLFTFLAAMAIIDDIGAILVVAVFYTTNINMPMLASAFFLVVVLIVMNYAGFRKPFLYIIIGLVIWAFIEAAGIHGTIAGILVAFLIPARPRKGPRQFLRKIKTLLKDFEKRTEQNTLILEDQKQHSVLEEVQEVTQQATTPLQSWESKLELPIALLVLPLFAFVNVGIPVDWHLIDGVFTHRVSLGIFLGLVVGKPSGVLLFSQIALWCRLGLLPENTKFYHIVSISFLTGIGFTMSLFITNLSFQSNAEILVLAKAAVVFGSIVAGLISISFFFRVKGEQS